MNRMTQAKTRSKSSLRYQGSPSGFKKVTGKNESWSKLIIMNHNFKINPQTTRTNYLEQLQNTGPYFKVLNRSGSVAR